MSEQRTTDLQLIERPGMEGMSNTLRVEPSTASEQWPFVWLCIYATGTDPTDSDEYILLDRAQAIALRDYIEHLLSEQSQ